MSKRTLSKKLRTKHKIIGYRENITGFDGKEFIKSQVPIPGKVAGYIPAPELEVKEVRYGVHIMKVRIAPGQAINLKKEFKRQRAAGLI